MKKHIICILILSFAILGFSNNVDAKSKQHDSSEQWRVTMHRQASPPSYDELVNMFHAYIWAEPAEAIDWYYVFPSSGRERTVEGARVMLLSRTGNYEPGQVLINLKVYNLQGVYQSTASSTPLNLETISVLEWAELSLSQNDMDRTVHSNEYLAYEIQYTDKGSTTSLVDFVISFEVDMESFESGDKEKFRIGEDVVIGGP